MGYKLVKNTNITIDYRMSTWLGTTTRTNRILNTYVKGFVDVSGGDLIMRNGDISANGNVSIGGETTVNGNIVPTEGATYNLGSADKPFKSLFISSNSIKFQDEANANVESSLSVVDGGVAVTTTDSGSGESSDASFVLLNNFRVGINKTSSTATANLDVSGNAYISDTLDDCSINHRLGAISTKKKLYSDCA